MNYKIGVTRELNRREFYTYFSKTQQSNHLFRNLAEYVIDSRMSSQCSHAIPKLETSNEYDDDGQCHSTSCTTVNYPNTTYMFNKNNNAKSSKCQDL